MLLCTTYSGTSIWSAQKCCLNRGFAYFAVDLLNTKTILLKNNLLKPGFLLILMLLKSGFHCIAHEKIKASCKQFRLEMNFPNSHIIGWCMHAI